MSAEDLYYPTVDKAVIKKIINDNLEAVDSASLNRSAIIILKGNGSIHRRIILIRWNKSNEVSFNTAISIANKCGRKGMKTLLDWLYQNKGWKDGAYVSGHKPSNNRSDSE